MTQGVAIEGGFLPDMSEDDQRKFTPSELILYQHALDYKWTAEELKKIIAMLHYLEFIIWSSIPKKWTLICICE